MGVSRAPSRAGRHPGSTRCTQPHPTLSCDRETCLGTCGVPWGTIALTATALQLKEQRHREATERRQPGLPTARGCPGLPAVYTRGERGLRGSHTCHTPCGSGSCPRSPALTSALGSPYCLAGGLRREAGMSPLTGRKPRLGESRGLTSAPQFLDYRSLSSRALTRRRNSQTQSADLALTQHLALFCCSEHVVSTCTRGEPLTFWGARVPCGPIGSQL